MRVSKVLSDHLYELKDLRNSEFVTVHSSQIKFYRSK